MAERVDALRTTALIHPLEESMGGVRRFFGIVITMYYKEHAPPHFHAKYAGERAAFSISDLQMIEGRLPPRAISLVLEWAFQHRDDLMEDWRRVESREELLKIDPLA